MICLTLVGVLLAQSPQFVECKVCHFPINTRITKLDSYELRRTFRWVNAHSDVHIKVSDWKYAKKIMFKESSLRPRAKNPLTTSRGLNGFTRVTRRQYMKNATLHCPSCQTQGMIKYVNNRYKTFKIAVNHHNLKGWY